MTADATLNVPEGYARHYRPSPLTSAWEPLFSRKTETAVIIGFRAATVHTNSRGFVHGGMISALADNAMGLSCGLALEGNPGLVTVTLALDFLGAAEVGQWIEITPTVNRAGGLLCFAEATVTADGEPCAKARGTFRVMRRETKR
jgi:uncharacterized protein (TIGR00369 family)